MDMHRLTAEQRNEVVRRYVSGKTSIALADEFGVAVSTVLREVRRSGEIVRSSANGQEKLTLKQRDEVVRRYVAGENSLQLADCYGVSYHTILCSVRRAGEEVRPRLNPNPSMFIETQEQEICSRYVGGLSVPELSLMFECTDCTIYRVLKENSISLRSRAFRVVRHDAFKDLKSEAALYWSGFIFADGCIRKRASSSVLQVILSDIDKNHLFKLQYYLNTDFSVVDNNYANDSYFHNPRSRLTIVSDEICDDLLSYGRYDGSLHPSLLSSRHFWRGFVDGDGSLGVYLDRRWNKSFVNFQICGTQYMCESFKNRFALSGHNSKANVRLNSAGNIYLYSLKNKVAVDCIRWLYGDATVYLDRKYETAQRILREYG